jgi:hypothetical protein
MYDEGGVIYGSEIKVERKARVDLEPVMMYLAGIAAESISFTFPLDRWDLTKNSNLNSSEI